MILGKVGTKKLRKLEEKAERRRLREIELQEREVTNTINQYIFPPLSYFQCRKQGQIIICTYTVCYIAVIQLEILKSTLSTTNLMSIQILWFTQLGILIFLRLCVFNMRIASLSLLLQERQQKQAEEDERRKKEEQKKEDEEKRKEEEERRQREVCFIRNYRVPGMR